MLPIYLPLIVAIIGLLVYVVFSPRAPNRPGDPILAEIGRIAYAFGLLAFLLTYTGHILLR